MRLAALVAPAVACLLAACEPRTRPEAGEGTAGPGEACAARRDCRGELLCVLGACAAAPPAAPACAPPRVAAPTAGSAVEAADPGPSLCVSSVRGAADGLAVQDLGALRVGERATFTVPPGTAGLLLVQQALPGTAQDLVLLDGRPAQNAVVPREVRAPGGALFFDLLAPLPIAGRYQDPTQVNALAPGFGAVIGTFAVPNTSPAVDRIRTAGALPAGEWALTVGDLASACGDVRGCAGGGAGGVYRLGAVTRPGPVTSTGTLDLEITLAFDPEGAPTHLRSAAAAAASPALGRFVRSLGVWLGKAGLCLGTVTVRDLPPWARERYAPSGIVDLTDEGPCGPMQQLFATASPATRGVPLFLADELLATAGGEEVRIVGVAGSIPGPSGFPGTIASGIVAGLFGQLDLEAAAGACARDAPDLAGCGADRLAYVTAHEIGHWLGLFHTTESHGVSFDPISDTAPCPCDACAPASRRAGCVETAGEGYSTLVLGRWCAASRACGGGDNLMFWLVDPAVATGELSADQGQVARLNPAVR